MGYGLRARGIKGGLLIAGSAVLALLAFSVTWHPGGADAASDERTISFYEIHLRETTTITFKRDGKFIPEGLKKFNKAMRDWRTGAVTRMDPKLLDLVWQLHKDVGAKGPVHVISGHRSAKTNRKLRRRGGGQAKKSQHVQGRAMDIHFPGITMSRVRKAAFVHEVGGVGYYPTSALPFVHVDTARVRSWPRMSRSQLAMLFPYGKTRHRPSSGGRLTLRDQKKARIRLAALERKSKSRTTTLLASASIPAAKISPATSIPASAAKKPARPIVLASLTNNQFGKPETRGLSRHASRLWVNGAGNSAFTNDQYQAKSPAIKQALSSGKGASYAKSPSRVVPTPAQPGAAPRARVQLASLSPQETIRPKSDPTAKLWVNGAGLRATWLTETEPRALSSAPDRQKDTVRAVVKTAPPTKTTTVAKAPARLKKRVIAKKVIAQKAITPKAVARTTIMAKTPIIASFQQTKTPHLAPVPKRTFNAERVAYAPTFDEEHPDELSYRPFQIMPLLSSRPVALNKSLVAMAEPKYDRIYEVLTSSENIPMQFRPSSREAETLWNNQFKGNAILNIRKHTQNSLRPARTQRLASR